MTELSRNSSEETLKSEKWMTCPKDYCEFPGLAYIYPLNQLIVSRKMDKRHLLMEKHDISYTVYNNSGEKVFIGIQVNQTTQFQIKLFNVYGNEVLHMKKYCNFLVSKVLILAPPGNLVGSVDSSFFHDRYEVKNSGGDAVILIKKLYPRDFVYSVFIDGEEVGAIMKDWAVKKHDNYMVSFPANLEVRLKAAILGACFLIMQKCLKCWNKNR